MDGAIAHLPHAAAAAAHDSLAGALQVAAQAGGPAGARLAHTAQAAFVDGMHTALFAGAGVVLVAAAIALRWLPARDPEAGRAPEAVDA